MSATQMSRVPATVAYFGNTYAGPFYENVPPIFRPHHQACRYCGEPIDEHDDGFRVPSVIDGGVRTYEFEHRECYIAQGSGKHRKHDDRLTVRQNALLTCLYFFSLTTGDATEYYHTK